MKINTRLIALLLLISLCLCLFAACSTATSDTSSQGAEELSPVSAPSTEQSIYPLADETVTLSLFFSVAPNLASMLSSMNDITAYDEAEKATNVHLDATISTPETTSEKFNVMIASGTYTDLIHNMERNYSGGMDKAIDDGVVVDLSDYAAASAPNYTAFLDSNPTAKKLYTTENGALAAITGLSYSFVQGANIRYDWLEDCNLEIPKTIEDLHTVLTAFKTEKGAKNALLFTIGNIYLAGSFNLGDGTGDGTEGAVYNIIDGKVEMCYFIDEYYDFIKTLSDWYGEGLYSDDFISLFGAGVADAFVLTDDTGYWYGAQDNLGAAYAASYTGVSDNFTTMPVALVTRNEGDTIDTGGMINIGGESWTVTTSCSDPGLAVAYLDWFFTDEGTLVCNYGNENVSFVYDGAGTPVYTDVVVNNDDGLSQMQAQWLYTNFQAPYIQDDKRNDSLYTDEAQLSALGIWDSNRTDSRKYYGSMTAEESEQYSQYSADLETFAGEELLKYIVNESELTAQSWSDFLDTLRSLNSDGMIALKQSAYDRYLAK